jgi:hypothetical protein
MQALNSYLYVICLALNSYIFNQINLIEMCLILANSISKLHILLEIHALSRKKTPGIP